MVRDPRFKSVGRIPHGPHQSEAAARQWLELQTASAATRERFGRA